MPQVPSFYPLPIPHFFSLTKIAWYSILMVRIILSVLLHNKIASTRDYLNASRLTQWHSSISDHPSGNRNTNIIGGGRVWVNGMFIKHFKVFIFRGRKTLFSWSQMALITPLQTVSKVIQDLTISRFAPSLSTTSPIYSGGAEPVNQYQVVILSLHSLSSFLWQYFSSDKYQNTIKQDDQVWELYSITRGSRASLYTPDRWQIGWRRRRHSVSN